MCRSVLMAGLGVIVATTTLAAVSGANAASSSTTAKSLVADATAAGVKAAKDAYGVTVETVNQPLGTYRQSDATWFINVDKGSTGTAFSRTKERVKQSTDHAIRSAYARAAVANLKAAGLKLTATAHADSTDAAFSLQAKYWACTVLAGAQTETDCQSRAAVTAALARVAPMVNVYAKAYPQYIRNTAFDLQWIHAGIKHYKRAEVGFGSVPASGGSMAYFAASPKNQWVFVQDTQDMLYCAYPEKTVTGSRGWAYASCYRQSTKKSSTVRPR